MITGFTRRISLLLILLCLLTVMFVYPLAVVYADGGAPQRAYIAGTAKGVSVVDIGQQKVVDQISVKGQPFMVLLSVDGRFLYATQPELNQVAIIVARTGETFCTAKVSGRPTLLALDINANLLFAAGNEASTVTSIDPTNCNIKRTFQVADPVYGLAVAGLGTSLAPDSDNELWVAHGKALTVFSDTKGRQIANVPLESEPHYLSIPVGGATVYATTKQGGILAVNLNSYNVTSLLPDGSGTYGPMDFNENTQEEYVPDRQNSRLVVLAPVYPGVEASPQPRRTIPLETAPESVAITSDGLLCFIALANGKVAMYDIPSHQITNTIDAGGHPTFIITGLNPPILATTPQQAVVLQTILNIGAYVIVIVLLIVPIILFRRYSKTHAREQEKLAKESQREDTDEEQIL